MNSLQLSCYVISADVCVDTGKTSVPSFTGWVLHKFPWSFKIKQACKIKISPACPLKCTVSSQLPNPTLLHLWCQWAPARRSVPSSCWAVSVPPCGVWHRCGWLWPAWVWWSPWTRAAAHSSVGRERRGSAMCWSCCPLTSWGSCF